MDTKKLRQKILDLAIRGKLVPQDPNDEPASVLLERIRAEKQQLIKEGKIKASKGSKACDTSHYEKIEDPFEIPESWEWCKLDDLCTFLSRGKSPKYSETDKTYPVFAQKCNLKEGGISLEKAQFLEPSTLDRWPEIYHLRTGDVLVNSTGTGTVGRTRLFYDSCLGGYAFVVPDSHVSVIRTHTEIVSEYIFALMSSSWIQAYIEDNLAGSTNQKELYIGVLQSIDVPLPPLKEQHKIVESIENWIRFVDDIEKGADLLSQHIEQFKSKVLSLAISGKIVPQDTSEEPAIELLKRINPDFKPCDNSHYEDLPIGWSICTLYDICDTINGLWKGKNPPFVNVGVIRNANFTKDFNLDYSKIEYIDVEQRAFEKRNLEDGDLIVEKSGGSDNFPVGRSILYQGESGKYSFSNFTMALRIKDKKLIRSRYLYFVILHKYVSGEMRQMQTQTTGLHNLLSDKYMSMSIPIPPTKEQDRIIDSIEKLLNQMNKIKTVL